MPTTTKVRSSSVGKSAAGKTAKSKDGGSLQVQTIDKLDNGKTANMTPAMFSLGGATLDSEWNHIQQKLMRGLGIVAIENQARI